MGKRWPLALVGLSAACGSLSACEKLVGIEDTVVVARAGSAGAESGGSAAADNADGSNAGTTTDGGAAGSR